MQCLICLTEINNSRLGVNSCRACAAFYKRAEGQLDQLKCKSRTNRCREKNPKTSCRKCRLVRFKEVLDRAAESAPVIELKSSECEEDPLDKQSSFIDHTSFYESEPSNSETPLLDKIRKGYSYMCVIRRCGELVFKINYDGEEVQSDNLVLTPADYSTMIPIVDIQRNAIIECMNFAFDEYRNLEFRKKDDIVRIGLVMIDILESTYRACHHFPDDLEIRLNGYTTYIRSSSLESFIDTCPENIDKVQVHSEFKQTLRQLSSIARHQFEIVKPTDVEFVALFGLALWKDENVKHDEHLLSIATRIRSEIMRELHVYYARKGTVDYASRLGSIFCILMNCEDCATRFYEDFQFYRLLNLFDNTFCVKE
ncbi:hypothetical protein PMAYCL1PPCAC_17392 [Pristionchus mayeri]|uniref:Nuclear receptor n=1 Tax=Pristionchus mayeri TaxID=1317129 RepID=A0AAN5CMP8_9BILA|nr:hypothetical protein PMAYCL1PPCAC_17392 [Pristionchus mayeri]